MNNNAKKVSLDFRAMGTDISMDIVIGHPNSKGGLGISEAQKALQAVQRIFLDNEKIFSRFHEDSELSKINNNRKKEISISDKMLAVLQLCVKFYTLSGGYFDPRILQNLEKIGYDKDFKTNDLNRIEKKIIQLEKIEQDLQKDLLLDVKNKTVLIYKKIDTTGIAKGYSVDEAAQYLKKEGYRNFIIDAGGDMFASGSDEDGEDWRIGVEGMDNSLAMLKINNEGIATSGISRKHWSIGDKKYHHLINPKDPKNFLFDIKTVTVIDEKTVEADGRAKVLVIMGKKDGLAFANKNNIKALFLDYRGNVYLSEAIKEKNLNL